VGGIKHCLFLYLCGEELAYKDVQNRTKFNDHVRFFSALKVVFCPFSFGIPKQNSFWPGKK
jgi:hypothetical protein